MEELIRIEISRREAFGDRPPDRRRQLRSVRGDPVRPVVLSHRSTDLVEIDPREGDAEEVRLLEISDRVPLRLAEGVEDVPGEPRVSVGQRSPDRDDVHDREQAGVPVEATLLLPVIGPEPSYLRVSGFETGRRPWGDEG